MGVEGDDVPDAHIDQLLETQGAVQALAGGAAVLTAFIEHGLDHRDALGLAGDGGDDALEVLEMIVGRHGHFLPVHFIGNVMGAHIHDDVHVQTADALAQHGLAFTRAKARAGALDQEGIAVYTRAGVILLVLHFLQAVPFEQPLIDLFADLLAAGHGDDAKRADWYAGRVLFPCGQQPGHDFSSPATAYSYCQLLLYTKSSRKKSILSAFKNKFCKLTNFVRFFSR